MSDGRLTRRGPEWSSTSSCREVDLIEVGRRRPMVALLGALRALPEVITHLWHGHAPAHPPATLRLREMATLPAVNGGWVLLGERAQDEIALGLVGRFWRPVIEFAAMPAPEAFRAFAEPGFAKTIYSLSVRAIDAHRTLLIGTMRTATTDAHARTWFRRYWTLGVGAGAHVLVNGLLDVTRDIAGESVRPDAGRAPWSGSSRSRVMAAASAVVDPRW